MLLKNHISAFDAKLTKLRKAAKRAQCNLDFMNKIEVRYNAESSTL